MFPCHSSQKKKVLSFFLNLESSLALLMSGGSLLYSLGAAELKARNPILEENRDSWSVIPEVARRVPMLSPGCIICNSSLKYGG